MRPYAAVLSARFRVLLQYRAAALAGFATQVFFGLLRVMIYTAFFAATVRKQPMDLEQVTTYIWLGQALLLLLPAWLDGDVQALVRSGNVACELVKPVDVYGLWFCRAVAMRLAPVALRCVPMVIVAGLFLGLRAPAGWASACAFAGSLLAAVLLSSAVTVLLNVTLFWTLAGDGIVRLATMSVWLFSGLVVPLAFFPDWLQPLINFLPFRGLMDVPFRLYMGHLPPAEAPALIGQQLAWTLVFVLLGRGFLARGLRRVVVQGG